MIARASFGHSLWDQVEVDALGAARKARLEHAAEVLLELGYDHLAADLLRLEREGERLRLSSIEPAA